MAKTQNWRLKKNFFSRSKKFIIKGNCLLICFKCWPFLSFFGWKGLKDEVGLLGLVADWRSYKCNLCSKIRSNSLCSMSKSKEIVIVAHICDGVISSVLYNKIGNIRWCSLVKGWDWRFHSCSHYDMWRDPQIQMAWWTNA